jgi:hypothetical protein
MSSLTDRFSANCGYQVSELMSQNDHVVAARRAGG